MRLAHPQLLALLLLVPAAVLAYAVVFAHRRRVLARLGNPTLIARMSAGASMPRKVFRAALVCLSLGLVALALARPQAGGKARLEKQRGLDIVVALDFSKSMLAKDIYPSRLERAKRELEQLMDRLSGDRVGLVAFAGETLTYPPTTDYDAVKLFWRDLSPTDMPVGGTAIGRALTTGIDMLSRLRAKGGETRDQVILLLTDGEDTESQPLEAADQAAKLGIKIFAVGIGSRSGELVPELGENEQAAGYIKDHDGKYVTSRLDEDLLAQIAGKTGGGYLRADAQHFGVEAIEAALARLKRTESETRLVKQYDEVFEYLLFPALLLLLLEACISERRRTRPAAKAQAHAMTVLLALLPFVPFLGAWNPIERNNRAVENGNASMKAGKAEEALSQYDKAVADLPADPGVHFNRGNALFALSRFEEASNEFLRATQAAAPALKSSAFYNLGNSYFKDNKYDDAVAAYRHALALDPANARAKWNLELALQKKKEEDKKKEDQKKNDQDKKDQDKDKKDQDKKDQDKDKKDQDKDKKDQDKKDQDKKDQDKKDQDKKDQDKKDQDKKDQDKQENPQDQQQKQDPGAQQQPKEQPAPGKDDKTPDMREIDAVLDNLEHSPKDLEKMRARLRAVRRAPPSKDW
jgi:Ca-activated chloride channel family protein